MHTWTGKWADGLIVVWKNGWMFEWLDGWPVSIVDIMKKVKTIITRLYASITAGK